MINVSTLKLWSDLNFKTWTSSDHGRFYLLSQLFRSPYLRQELHTHHVSRQRWHPMYSMHIGNGITALVGLLHSIIGISAIMHFGNGGLLKFWAMFLSFLLVYTLFLFLYLGISAIMHFGNGGLVKFWAEFLSLLLMYTLFLFLYYSVSSLKIFFVWGSAWCDRFRDYYLGCSLNFELCFYLYCWCTYCSCSFIILFQILKYFFV